MTDKLSFICIDKRVKDARTNQQFIVLENGTRVLMPPNIHSVPALLLVSQKFQFIYGDDIIQHFHQDIVVRNNKTAKQAPVEPIAYHLGNFASSSNITSEKYTPYNLTPDELSAKGTGRNRSLYNYVSIHEDPEFIETPADNYHPDKIDNEITVDRLQQQRMDEVTRIMPKQQPLGGHI